MNEWAWSGSLALAFVCAAISFGRLLPDAPAPIGERPECGLRGDRADGRHRALATLAGTQPRRGGEFPCHRAHRARRKRRTGFSSG